MRKHGRAMIEGAGLLLVGLLLFLFPEESVAAAREGISLCVDVLIPSLFPFFVLSSLLISTGLAGLCARPLESFMRPLFGVGGAGAAALSLGLIGGYPVEPEPLHSWYSGGSVPRRRPGGSPFFAITAALLFLLVPLEWAFLGRRRRDFSCWAQI